MAVMRNEPHQDLDEGGIVLTPQQQRSRRLRNIAIGIAIELFVGLIYFVTLAKLGSNVLERPL